MKRLYLLAVLALLHACASTGTSYPTSATVGPSASKDGRGILAAVSAQVAPTELTLNIATFDPGLPDDPSDYERMGIWPELRRTESARFPLRIAQEIEKGGVFSRVRLSPDTTAAASLYLQGKIIESNGEDVRVAVLVTGIDGRQKLKKSYSHRVDAYAVEDPRAVGKDLYTPLFQDIAEDVNNLVRKMKVSDRNELMSLEFIRFASAFSPSYFDQYLIIDRKGRSKLTGLPAEGDPMVARVEAVRIKDQLFLDKLQDNYESFYGSVDTAYAAWQRGAYVESKAAREARNRANAKMFVGALAIVAGAAIAANTTNPYGVGNYTGAATAVAGVAAIASGVQDSKQAAAHKESLNELGRSLNADLSPTVVNLEDEVVEFTGSAAEQYRDWQAYLKTIYEVEQTPSVRL